MQSHRLADHARTCAIDDQVIVLDLARGRYLSVRQRGGLHETIVGWPRPSDGMAAAWDSGAIQRTLQHLQGQGLLMPLSAGDPADPARATATTVAPVLPEPTASLNATDAVPRPPIGPAAIARFCTAALRTSARLRFRSLLSAQQRLARRRGPAAAPIDESRLRRDVAAYERLRPLAFTAHDRCLFDSLALLDFLAPHCQPAWVVAVRLRPFAAHSWLQLGELVVNDQHDHVRAYRPILVV